MAAENEASVVPYDTENPTKLTADPRRDRRRRLLRRSAYAFVAALVLATVVLVPVGVTLYKVDNPKMTMKSVHFIWDNLSPGIFLRVLATGSVTNTNRVTYHFKRSVTTVYWEGKRLASATGPGGATPPGKSYELSLALDVGTDNEVDLFDLLNDLRGGSNVLAFQTKTRVDGQVYIFGMFRHKADVFIDCDLTVDFMKQRIISQSCKEWVKI